MKETTVVAGQTAQDVDGQATPSPALGQKAGPGRPRLCTEDLRVMAFKVPESIAEAFDAMLAQMGETRSSRLRALVERDLADFEASAPAPAAPKAV